MYIKDFNKGKKQHFPFGFKIQMPHLCIFIGMIYVSDAAYHNQVIVTLHNEFL